MPTRDDIQFVKIALSKKLVTTDRVGECLRILKTLEEHDVNNKSEKIGIEKIMIDKKYLTLEQVEEILESLHKKVYRCQNCNAKYRVSKSKSAKECDKCGGTLIAVERTPSAAEEKATAAVENVLRKHQIEDEDKLPPEGDANSNTQDSSEAETQEGDDPLVGQKFAGYEVLSKIGEGGMGSIYKARNIGLDRIVALKLLPNSLIEKTRQYVERFLTEARASARLNHPNAVAVYRVDEVNGQHFIEMEFVEGDTLKDLVKKRGPFDSKEASRIIKQAAKALDAAHEKSIIHRDIKPDNIMVTKDGKVKVADFGLAKNIAADSDLTDIGQMLGTPAYMSPEQCDGKPADARSDMYSLGATFFYILSGNHPFMGETPIATMYKHKHEPVPNIKEFNPDIPDSFQSIIEKMMAKNPDERYQTGTELIDALRAIEEPPLDNAYILPAEELEAIDSSSQIKPSNGKPEYVAAPHSETEERPLYPLWTPFRIGITLVGVLMVVLTIGILLSGGSEQPTQTGQRQTTKHSARMRPQSGIERRYNAMVEFVKKDPENYCEIIERFNDLAIAAEGTKFAQMAEAKKKEWETKFKKVIDNDLIERKQMADNFAKAKQFQKAIDVYSDFPWAWETEEVKQRIEKQRNYYKNEARNAFNRVAAKVSSLIKEHKFDEAKTQLEKAKIFGTAEVITRIENLLHQIERLARLEEHIEKELIRAEKIYRKALDAFKNKNYIEARQQLKELELDVKRPVLKKLKAKNPFFTQMKQWLDKRGNIITVKQDGEGEFQTIRDALSRAENGTTIEIYDGEYKESFNSGITSNKDRIVLLGAVGTMPKIETIKPIVCGADWKIENLNFRGEDTALKASSGSLSIEGCRFSSYKKQVILIEGYVNSLKVENCVFYRNQPGCAVKLVNLSTAGELVFENNTLHQNGGIIHHVGLGKNWKITVENNIFSEIVQPYRHGQPRGLAKWQAAYNYYFRIRGPFLTFVRGIRRPRILVSRLPIQKQIQELQRILESRIEEHSIFASPNMKPNFVNVIKEDFHLQRLSPCRKRGKNGKDFGVQWNEIERQKANVGTLLTPPTPP